MRQDWDYTSEDIAGSDGTATVTITAPIRPGFKALVVTGTSVRTSTGRSDKAKAYLFRDRVDGPLVGSTDKGGASSSTGRTKLGPGSSLVAQWTGATAGETCTLYAEGYLTDENE